MHSKFDSLDSLLNTNKILLYATAWKEVSGLALANICEFQGISRNAQGHLCLRVGVQDPLWRQELHFQKKDILFRYNKFLGERGLKDFERPTDLSLAHKVKKATPRH